MNHLPTATPASTSDATVPTTSTREPASHAADVFGATSEAPRYRPRIDRAEIKARAVARLERERLGEVIDRQSPNKPALYNEIGKHSPFKLHSSPEKGKARSSIQSKWKA